MKIKSIILALIFGAFSFIGYGQQWTQVGQDIVGPNGTGTRVGISNDGNSIAVYLPVFEQASVVRVYDIVDQIWVQRGEALPAFLMGEAIGDLDMSDDGNTVAVGAWMPGATAHGEIRMFTWFSDEWVQMGEGIEGLASQSVFGHSIDLNNDGTIVAAGANIFNDFTGYCQVYQWNTFMGWIQLGETIYGNADSRFGSDVEIDDDGTKLIVSAVSAGEAGQVYTYSFAEGWALTAPPLDTSNQTNSGGISMDSSGTNLIIGTSIAGYPGTITYYNWDDEWIMADSIQGFQANDLFGFRCDISNNGDKIVISAPFADNDNCFECGISSVYILESGTISNYGESVGGLSSEAKVGDVKISGDGNTFIQGIFDYQGGIAPVRVFRLGNQTTGCTDIGACNYNSNSTEDDGSCVFPECFRDCEGACLSDLDGDGVCDELEVPYNPDINNNQSIGVEDLLGVFPLFGAAYVASCQGDKDNPTLVYNPDADSNNIIGVTDMLSLFPLFGQPFSAAPCPVCISGCTNAEASNYNPAATVNDGSCVFGLQGDQHTCGAANVHNPDLVYGSVTDIDGNTYRTIVIGEQEWLAENLTVEHYANGDPIPNIINNQQWGATMEGAWCYYNNSPQFECPYGKLYNWYVTVDERNVCPSGWHVPTDAEWTILTDHLGGVAVSGGKIKSTGTTYWEDPNISATNESGFSGLPGGVRYANQFGIQFSIVGNYGYWWSSTANVFGALGGNLNHFNGNLDWDTNNMRQGRSVRCVKD